MRTSTSTPPASMKPRGWNRKRLKPWKRRLHRPRPEKISARKKRNKAKRARKQLLRNWKMPALNSARLPQPDISSAHNVEVDRSVAADVAAAADGVPCADGRGTSHRGLCPPSATC